MAGEEVKRLWLVGTLLRIGTLDKIAGGADPPAHRDECPAV